MHAMSHEDLLQPRAIQRGRKNVKHGIGGVYRDSGDENQETIHGLGVLATILLQQRRCEEVEAMTARVLKLQRVILGHKHADTILSMGNMAANW